MAKRLSFVLALALGLGFAGVTASSSSAAVPISQQKFCSALTGDGGTGAFSAAAVTGTGATGLSKSLQKLAKTTSSKTLKSSLTTLASFYKRLGNGEKLSSFSSTDATKYSKAVAKFTSAAATCTAVSPSVPPSSSAASSGGLSGTWSGQYSGASSGTFNLTWQQSGANLSGTIMISGLGNAPISINGTVSGSTISFGTVGTAAVTYSGTVSGTTMSGTYQSPTGDGNWTAAKAS
jgi:hypothetical protein